MRNEIIEKILSAPLSDWTGHYKLILNDVTINLIRENPGGPPCFYLNIEGVIINDKRLKELYYALYERDQKDPEEEKLKPIYEKLCK